MQTIEKILIRFGDKWEKNSQDWDIVKSKKRKKVLLRRAIGKILEINTCGLCLQEKG